MTKNIHFVLALMASTVAFPAFADDAKPDFAQEKLTGNWGGQRDRFFENGVSFDVYYKVDAWSNFSGGVKTGNSVLDNLDLQMTIDGEKAFNAEGTTVFVAFLNNFGGRPNDFAGTNGGIDNIEVPEQAFKLYGAWVQKEFRGGTISVLAGLHDLNSEFYVTDTSGLFLNPSYGIGTEMAATGDNGPSIFPYTAPAIRLALYPAPGVYLQGAIYDGVPGDPNQPRGTHIRFGDNEGALAVAEGGINGDAGHFAIGGWTYTAKRPDLATPADSAHSRGMYFLADKSVYKEGECDVSVFARYGFTAGDVEQFKNNASAGVVFSGFIPSRPDGQVGFAATISGQSDKYRAANAPAKKNETQFELTYADKLTPWLSVQPDLQYTINPGAVPNVDNAWTVGLRIGIDF